VALLDRMMMLVEGKEREKGYVISVIKRLDIDIYTKFFENREETIEMAKNEGKKQENPKAKMEERNNQGKISPNKQNEKEDQDNSESTSAAVSKSSSSNKILDKSLNLNFDSSSAKNHSIDLLITSQDDLDSSLNQTREFINPGNRTNNPL
jgi:hypothetical protein